MCFMHERPDDYPDVACPKCGRRLPADGELSLFGLVLPVYQCSECVSRNTVLGETMEVALTFVIGPDGKPYDPTQPDGQTDLTRYE
jgi:DNA-directed RNA polymerase subunit RPC12/RpoP